MQETASQPSPEPQKRPFPFRSALDQAAPALHVVGTEEVPASWSLAHRLGFRFLFLYFLLYLAPFPLDSLPGLGALAAPYQEAWNAFVPWVGAHVLSLAEPISVLPNGSGDTTFNYVQILCYAGLAFLGALVWSALDRRRRAYPRLREFLRIYVRFGLGVILLSYGLIKVIKTQFPTPDLDRMFDTYGNSSPMGLLWTFMGASTAYTVFAGATEVVGGLLLFFRRTATLGALVSAGVMANVVMLNFCYDVPVKLFSLHLFLMALWLAAPGLAPLADVLFFHRPATPVPLERPFRTPWMNRAATAAGLLFLGYILFVMIQGNLEAYRRYGDGARKPPLYGAYQVDEVTLDGRVIPPSLLEGKRFRRVVFTRYGLAITRVDDTRERFQAALDPKSRTFTLTERATRKEVGKLRYVKTADGGLQLSGTLHGQACDLRLSRMAEGEFLLTSRGFRWIHEFPFNR